MLESSAAAAPAFPLGHRCACLSLAAAAACHLSRCRRACWPWARPPQTPGASWPWARHPTLGISVPLVDDSRPPVPRRRSHRLPLRRCAVPEEKSAPAHLVGGRGRRRLASWPCARSSRPRSRMPDARCQRAAP